MYNNAGGKVKGLASFITTLMMIVCVLVGLVTMFSGYRGRGFLPGLLIIAGGCLAAWLSGLMMAAFGELVENTYYIRKMLAGSMNVDEKGEAAPAKPAYADVAVTPADINAVMQRDGIPYGDAVVRAKQEKMAGAYSAPQPSNNTICPNCGSPRKGSSAFCGFCGTKL